MMDTSEPSFVVLRHMHSLIVLPVFIDAVHASTVVGLIWPQLRQSKVTKLLHQRWSVDKCEPALKAWLYCLPSGRDVVGYNRFYCKTRHLRSFLSHVRVNLASCIDRIHGLPPTNIRASILSCFMDEEVWGDIMRAPVIAFTTLHMRDQRAQSPPQTPVSEHSVTPSVCPSTPALDQHLSSHKRKWSEPEPVVQPWADIAHLFD